MSHPDPDGPADLTPIEVGEVWVNPVTGDRATFLELPSTNPDGRSNSERGCRATYPELSRSSLASPGVPLPED
jgi:hypothetical protein